MKVIKLLILSLLITYMHTVVAGIPTNAVRTDSGQIVSVGDSYISMINKFQKSPLSSRSYEIEENRLKYTVTEYYFLVDNSYYTITIMNNSIKSISWDRKFD